MCCCASRRVFIASPCRPCASPNSSANACFCEGRSQKSTNRHPATPASLNSNTPPTNWNFDMLDFPRTALRLRGDDSWRVCATSLALALLTCLIATDGFTAPLPSQLGPEVAITRPRDGYVGRLNVAPENGPAGTEVTVTADQLPPNQELALVWRTVKGNWKVDGPEYHGRDFKPVGYEIVKVKSDNDGRLSARFVVPEDFGFAHDIVLEQGDRLLTQVNFSIDMSVETSPKEGPLGTPITVTVKGIGWRPLFNSWLLLYDNRFTGWMSAVTTGGQAKVTNPATGRAGDHITEGCT